MSDPNVEQGGRAVDGPDSALRRGRSLPLGVLAFVLLIGGIAATVVGIVQLAGNAGPSDDRILARGIVTPLGTGGPDLPENSLTTFTTSDPGDVTVWLQLGGPDNVRSSIVAGTACDLTRADGSTDEILGSRQGNAVAVDDYETIGDSTISDGSNTITCRHVPFGPVTARGALEEPHEFVVERGTPGDGLGGLWLVLPGVPLALLGGYLAIGWNAGRVRPVTR